MTAPNEQEVVNGKLVVVTLVAGINEAAITVGNPGSPSRPAHVSIAPFLKAGLDEREALKSVKEIACIAVRGATS
ncbi:hypothetical protein [Burkholderia ubonensis]|uniref:hypothetical protein n=1 Tax=Burkholderia ubonensis TaxID=101571 RepID=UPI001160E5B5|nr:hypothetical protein [Burkholderia ubonensis]